MAKITATYTGSGVLTKPEQAERNGKVRTEMVEYPVENQGVAFPKDTPVEVTEKHGKFLANNPFFDVKGLPKPKADDADTGGEAA